ncbi:LicD family protein [Candidatus Saccharibacteria bacterium]|nr:LicD family protein [Candidatus Saccharibacteria bacterium]
MKKDEYSDFAPLHKIVLNIYKDFRVFCEKNNLRFFAISGTTLGAVLWDGFIPWDDDMDIAMPVEDYLRFRKLSKRLPDYLEFSEYVWFGGKLHDKRTTFTNIHYAIKPDRYNGIFIDIVPLIALPNDEVEREEYIADLKKFQMSGILYDRYDVLFEISSKKELYRWRDKFFHTYTFGDTDYVMDFSDPRYTLSSSGFISPVMANFEDTKIPLSSNARADLSIQYGKYTKYPSKSSRRSIHQMLGILDLETPFSEYAQAYNALPDWVKSLFLSKHTGERLYLESIYSLQNQLTYMNAERALLQKRATEIDKEIGEIYSSTSYKLGNAVVRPFSRVKRLLTKR